MNFSSLDFWITCAWGTLIALAVRAAYRRLFPSFVKFLDKAALAFLSLFLLLSESYTTVMILSVCRALDLRRIESAYCSQKQSVRARAPRRSFGDPVPAIAPLQVQASFSSKKCSHSKQTGPSIT